MKLKPHEHDVVVKRPRHPQATRNPHYERMLAANDSADRLCRRVVIGMIIWGLVAGFLVMHYFGTAS